jgi:glc operon protein GlcG
MKRLTVLSTAFVLMSAARAGDSPLSGRPGLTAAGARQVVAAAAAQARKSNSGGAIAVVDEGGNLIHLERLDGTFAASAGISIGKARTAALFQRPTKAFEEIIAKGRTAMVALPDFTPLQGGIPILVEGKLVGAIGVSGATSAQADEEIALAGAEAAKSFGTGSVAERPQPAVASFEAARVAAAFARGAPLLETESYKVHASRREAPGMAEVHLKDTDIIYVLEGAAVIVTGGNVVDEKTTAPGEVRGAAIRDGETRRLAKGDVVIVPDGTPHWFKEVTGPLTYYVVKVPTGCGGAQ